jgi:hypothetical protein
MIASLLRLARADADDAQALLERGSRRNAAFLLASAVSHLIGAVASAEPGSSGPPEMARIAGQNPLKAPLAGLEAGLRPQAAVQANGLLGEPPDADQLLSRLEEIRQVLRQAAGHFGVSFDDDEPAQTAAPLRAEPVLSPLPPSAQEDGAEPSARQTRARPKRTEPPDPAPAYTAPPVRSGGSFSSAAFWSLMDRWGIADADALDLLGHAGGLTKKGTRPRFKLTPAEVDMATALQAIDEVLASLNIKAQAWLSKPVAAEPFRGGKPIDLIKTMRLEGARSVHRSLTQMSLRLSLQDPSAL